MTNICIKAIVRGKVQGVFYREGTRKKATALQLTGWVKNNDDGAVELHACGDEAQIQTLIQWLKKGPLLARVSQVDLSEIPAETHDAFTVTR